MPRYRRSAIDDEQNSLKIINLQLLQRSFYIKISFTYLKYDPLSYKIENKVCGSEKVESQSLGDAQFF